MQKLTEKEQLAIRDLQGEALRTAIAAESGRLKKVHWRDNFDDRQVRLIHNCQTYARDDPAGLPGHQLVLIVSKMADLLDG